MLSEVRVLNISKKVKIASLAFILMSVVIAIGASAQDYGNPFDSAGADAAFLGLSTVCCFVIALPFILGLVLGIWVYKDAEKRGKSGVLWLLIVWFVAFPIGLIIWLVVRPPIGGEPKQAASSERKCPNCGRIIPDDARVCPYCSKKFEE